MYLQHNYIHVHEDTCTHTHTHRQRLCQMHVHVHVYTLWKNVHKIHQPNKSEANSEPCTSILQLHCFYPHRDIDSVRYTQCIYISGLQKEVKSFQGAGQTPTFDPLKETLMSTKFFLTYTTRYLCCTMTHLYMYMYMYIYVHVYTWWTVVLEYTPHSTTWQVMCTTLPWKLHLHFT